MVKDWFEPSQFITFEHAMEQQKEWFKEWFNSPYYHILYGDRDQQEAEFFLRNLVKQFSPAPHATFLDLACGAGRHSIFLNNLGFQVTGIDLSKHSISIAKQYENPSLHFEVGDLRTFHLPITFDFVLNLFTSFGYFDCMDTNREVLHQVKQSLKHNGIFIIDFMNADKIIENLVPFELKERQGIVFEISKTLENGIIIKDISFTDQGKSFHYQEKVQALTLNDFNNLLSQCGFQLLSTFGNYALESYDRQESDRLILVSQLNHA